MSRLLIYIRRTLAILFGGAMLALFLDITHTLPEMDGLVEAQFVPLLLKGMGLTLALWLVLTLLVGRAYCSVFCPLGVLQDVIGRVKKWWYRAPGRRKALRMQYRRPLNILRYSVLGGVALCYALGLLLPLTLLDPYSTFGRIATALFRPVATWINNALAGVLNAAGNYSLYAIHNLSMSSGVVIASGVVLLVLIVMVWRSGRLWCNTLCPVGTLLGFFSRLSWLRIRIDAGCNHCGNCAATCKAQCIDAKSATVDASRCVSCFNCLQNCPKKAIGYSPGRLFGPVGAAGRSNPGLQPEQTDAQTTAGCAQPGMDASRRRFLKGSLATLAVLPTAKLLAAPAEKPFKPSGHRTKLPLPPGAVSRERFTRTCTACQFCVAACPTQVLRPALLENGLTGVMQPYMHFRVESFCSYECRVCMEVCPNEAITHHELSDKKLIRIGKVYFLRHRCIVHTEHQDCGACAEHCPTGAVHMVPWGDSGLTIPKVEPEFCIGCGGCESICPVQPRTAIFVQGIDTQERALPPLSEVPAAETIDDFGF